MLLETVRALNNAGRIALQSVCGLEVTAESVSQLGQGGLSFPALGDLVINGGGVNRVHLGADAVLCRRLGELDTAGEGGSGLHRMASTVLDALLQEVPGWRPRGHVGDLAVEPVAVRTRGVRTFGFRYVTAGGQFFMLAEVLSRAEWEHGRNSDFLPVMAQTYLPEGWSSRNTMAGREGVDNLLVYLRKVEADVYLCLGDGPEAAPTPAVFIGTSCATANAS